MTQFDPTSLPELTRERLEPFSGLELELENLAQDGSDRVYFRLRDGWNRCCRDPEYWGDWVASSHRASGPIRRVAQGMDG